jgi:regulatory associated protein of mTOR
MQGQQSSQADAHEADHASLGSLARWRNKDRIKTQAAALILCLNIGVDPPDVVKVSPCARMECWMQPDAAQSTRNGPGIAKALQQQYERWQPRARYKTQADPTVDDVKKLCREARRAARVRHIHSLTLYDEKPYGEWWYVPPIATL